MFGFGKKKYSETPWRTVDGAFKCQSEICPPDMCGSGRCPLDLQTMALNLMQMGSCDKARKFLDKAIVIEPNCAQIWCNYGACCGNLGDHVRARDAFRMAIKLRPGYKDAEIGLTVAEKNLTGGAKNAKSIRYVDVLDALLADAFRKGDIRDNVFKNVPELMPYANDIGQRLFSAIREDKSNDGDFISDYKIALIWSIFAGFGAVVEWDSDWPTLRENGVFETLTARRGVYAMDDYIIEIYTGERCDADAGIVPKAGKELSSKFKDYGMIVMSQLISALENVPGCDKLVYASANLSELTKACYLFGMSYALEKVTM